MVVLDGELGQIRAVLPPVKSPCVIIDCFQGVIYRTRVGPTRALRSARAVRSEVATASHGRRTPHVIATRGPSNQSVYTGPRTVP